MRALNSALRCRRFRLLILVLFRGGRPQKPAQFVNKPLAPFPGATSVIEDDIVAEGGAVERLYSKTDFPTGFFRVERRDQ